VHYYSLHTCFLCMESMHTLAKLWVYFTIAFCGFGGQVGPAKSSSSKSATHEAMPMQDTKTGRVVQTST